MNIVLILNEFFSKTGAPTYFFYLAKGLVENGHKVSIISNHNTDSFLYKESEKLGIKLYFKWDKSYLDEKFDMGIISHIQNRFILDEINCLFINLVHSKFDLEQPIEHHNIIGRLACREDVMNEWKDYYLFDGVLLNPIDLNKFSPKQIQNEKYTILSLSTLDDLRFNMLIDLIIRCANNDYKLVICGKDHINFKEKVKTMFTGLDFVEFKDETNTPEEELAKCDEIAGIYEGRVSLEGIAMGKRASIYDLDGSHYMLEYYDIKKHDYRLIAETIVNKFKSLLQENTVDIVVVRYGKKEMEDKCIETIKKHTIYPHRIIDIDNFEKNEGLSTIWNRCLDNTKSKYVCFINTDAFVTRGWLEKMMQTMINKEETGVVGPSGDNVYKDQGDKSENISHSEKYENILQHISGYCMLTLKTDVRFPEEVPFYSNDLAYGVLMMDEGYNLVHRTDAYVYHLDQKSQTEAEHTRLGQEGIIAYDKWRLNRKEIKLPIEYI